MSFNENDVETILQIKFQKPTISGILPDLTYRNIRHKHLYYGLKYYDDNNLLLEFKPQKVRIEYGKIVYAINIPWSLYLFTINKESSKFDMKVFFSDEKLLSLDQLVSNCWLHNVGDDNNAEVNKSLSEIEDLNEPDILYNAYIKRKLHDMVTNFWIKKFYIKYNNTTKKFSESILGDDTSIPKFLDHLATLDIPEIIKLQSDSLAISNITTIENEMDVVEEAENNEDTDYDLFELVLSNYAQKLYPVKLIVNEDKVEDEKIVKLMSLIDNDIIHIESSADIINEALSYNLLTDTELDQQTVPDVDEEIEPELNEISGFTTQISNATSITSNSDVVWTSTTTNTTWT